ncbi:MAG: cytochrome c peroxidase [Patiriisocius sp.]|jgi:cytochrome c peroxidase
MNKTILKRIFFIAAVTTLIIACKKDNDEPTPMPIVEFDETPYSLDYSYLPAPDLALDNPLTQQGVQLGRMLFYEKKLSNDNTLACAGCHIQEDGFSDTRPFSIGTAGLEGGRQAMGVINLAWNTNGFFWDGRSELARDQSLKPIQDPLEMNETLENAVAKLEATQMYKDQFKRAFDSEEITAEKMSLAMEQFMNSIVSVDSKFDKVFLGLETFTDSEQRGKDLFELEYTPGFPDDSGADCAHCHSGFNFQNNQYMNNGLDAVFQDMGFGAFTGNLADIGKFKVPTLRNIALTPPYMHDGRFETLEEVLDHYNEGIQDSPTVDPGIQNTMITGLGLSDQDKADLIAFLNTLTDETFATNPEYSNPF